MCKGSGDNATLGVPLALGKLDSPTTSLVFLGIIVDTVTGELNLPDEKLQCLHTLLQQWQSKRVCQRRELESLIGLLNHACKVVRPGRSFLRSWGCGACHGAGWFQLPWDE